MPPRKRAVASRGRSSSRRKTSRAKAGRRPRRQPPKRAASRHRASRGSVPRRKPAKRTRARARAGKAPRSAGRAKVAASYDAGAVERKWQAAWAQDRAFEARANPGRPKWYTNVPYPYMSGYQHMGFGVSFLRAEFQSRYRRMKGFNVLHPQAFHCTGLPILGAAKRVAEGEPKQIEILRQMGIPEAEIPKFAEPLHWIEVFTEATIEDLKSLGSAIDWRRSFITTSLNPPYDAFVRWQFRRLRDGGYVRIDKHPVIWCPKDQAPIGDHDRLEGEGETPSEFTLLKFPLPDGRILVAMTIRPETIFGQTNLWIDPSTDYVIAHVNDERWILNNPAALKLREQGKSVSVEARVKGADLVGQEVVAPGINRAIPILPASFIDQGRGTGIVTSVPSDAPDDYVALRELQSDDETLRRFHLDRERIRGIEPIPIIKTPGFGPLPAKEVAERMGIMHQSDAAKLAAAKAEVYKSGFYQGVMNENCGPYAGMRVEIAKEEVRKELLATGRADTLYEPSGEVVCRCMTRAIVKVVDNQWFLIYGDAAWKAKAHEALASMRLYPEASRKQMDYVLDWLHDWPCTHHRGLGTKLPWDDNWVIESLSDSTIYMAYFTIAHALQGGQLKSEVPWAQTLDDGFFDYVFFGQGDLGRIASGAGVPPDVIDGLRAEFAYWYPFDLRNTGKDLVQNHMAFCLFNHVAMFSPELWPRGFGVNGWVQMSGMKMSKSRGNVVYIRDAVKEFGADTVRMTVANAGDGLDDPNLEREFAIAITGRLAEWYAFAVASPKVRDDRREVDRWFVSVLNRAIASAASAMESMTYKAVLRTCYFDLQAAWAWYLRRSGGRPNQTVRSRFVEVQTKILAPFAPHVCEEIWHRLGHDGFIAHAAYPEARENEIDTNAEAAEVLLQSTLSDVREIRKVTQLRPKRILLYIAPGWMSRVRTLAVEMARDGNVSVNGLIERALSEPGMRERAREVAAYAKSLAQEFRQMRGDNSGGATPKVDELALFKENRPFLEQELGVPVEVYRADDPAKPDPEGRARHAAPGRPAIYLEGRR